MVPDGTILELMSRNLTSAVYILILLNVVQTTIGIIMWKAIHKMKEDVIWEDRFNEFKENISKRIESLEALRNGT